MRIVGKVHHLLAVLMERSLGRPECLVLCNHIFHIVDIHNLLVSHIHFQLHIRTEQVTIVILIVLVRFRRITVYQIFQSHTAFHFLCHNSILFIG